MNIKQYIESGTIEACLTGSASHEDMRELEVLRQKHPEIKIAVEEVQKTLDNYASMYAVHPPKELKDKIWARLSAVEEREVGTQNLEKITKSKSVQTKSFPWIKTVAAAAVILLIVSMVTNAYLWRKSNSFSDKITTLEQKLTENKNSYTKQIAEDRNSLDIILSANMKQVLLEGVNEDKADAGLVYWNASSKEVYLSLQDLPVPPADKQYQLWAIVDGKPVDAGVYIKTEDSSNLQKMKSVSSKVEKFAVTLENKGGAQTPDLSALYVAGEI